MTTNEFQRAMAKLRSLRPDATDLKERVAKMTKESFISPTDAAIILFRRITSGEEQ